MSCIICSNGDTSGSVIRKSKNNCRSLHFQLCATCNENFTPRNLVCCYCNSQQCSGVFYNDTWVKLCSICVDWFETKVTGKGKREVDFLEFSESDSD
jgi:hypothetical protein